jgi:hypothetical protein
MRKLFITLALLSAACIRVNASGMSHLSGVGNGGGAFICPDQSQSEFLDLYEARRGSLNIVASSSPVDQQIQKAFARLSRNPAVYQAVLKSYEIVKNAPTTPPPTGLQLAWPADEKNRYIKAGCEALGVMIFHDDTLAMDQDAISLAILPNTDQAAAWVHEAVYRFLRVTQDDTDSIRARAIIGHLFSDESDDQVASALDRLGLQVSGRPHPGLYDDGVKDVRTYIFDAIPDKPLNPTDDLKQCVEMSYVVSGSESASGKYSFCLGAKDYDLDTSQYEVFYRYRISDFLPSVLTPGDFNEVGAPITDPGVYDITLTDKYGNSVSMKYSIDNFATTWLYFYLPGVN